jgi:hypothetical protein
MSNSIDEECLLRLKRCWYTSEDRIIGKHAGRVILSLTFKLRGWPPRNLAGAPKVQKTTGRKENAYRPVPLECRVRTEFVTLVKQRPNPSATLRHETRNRHGQKSLDKKACRSRPACLATTDDDRPAKTAVVAKGCGATLPEKHETATDKKPAGATALSRRRRR